MTVICFSLYVYLVIFVQARVLREFSPEEVTANIYTMVDVLLHHIQFEVQRGHLAQVCLFRTRALLIYFTGVLRKLSFTFAYGLLYSEATMKNV